MLTKANYSDNEAVPTRWATVSLQPMPGSNERIVVAVAAVNDNGETRCLRTIDPANVKAVFRDEHRYVSGLIDFVEDSLGTHLVHAQALENWAPPVEGVFLTAQQRAKAADIDEFVRRAASLSTIFYHDHLQPQPKAAKPRRWMDAMLRSWPHETSGCATIWRSACRWAATMRRRPSRS